MGVVFWLASRASARSFRDIEPVHSMSVPDISGMVYLELREMAYKAEVQAGGSVPIASPAERQPTTNVPSPSPSLAVVGQMPTQHPTTSPTLTPTDSATTDAPTAPPTNVPDPYPPNEPPSNPDPWYFNYNVSPTSRHGPGTIGLSHQQGGVFAAGIRDDNWGQVDRPPNDYWAEFTDDGFGTWKSVLEIREPRQNKCSTGMLQSPIDLHENRAICREHHEVRSLPGDFQVTGRRVEKRIESNKLRLVYERRACSQLSMSVCLDLEPDPPHADFPNGWGGFADATHIDFKVPSEHTIGNEQFEGEMQIFHIHPGRRRVVAQSVLIRATSDGYNYYFQEALKAFQSEYDKNAANCRRRILSFNASGTSPYDDYLSWAMHWETAEAQPPLQQFEGGAWNPYHEMLIPSIYFYRYDGSITEPPCGEFVTWFVADEPMTIGLEQLKQLKHILFTNVNSSCQKTSVHNNDHSVARPIRLTNNRPVSKCTATDFGPDE